MEYTPEVVRRFDSPRRAGELSAGSPGLVAGEAEDRTLNVWVRFQLQVIDGAIGAVSFAVFGCPHVVAAAGRVAEWLEGRPVGELANMDVRALCAELEVPVEKVGKLLRIEDAVSACGRKLDKDVM